MDCDQEPQKKNIKGGWSMYSLATWMGEGRWTGAMTDKNQSWYRGTATPVDEWGRMPARRATGCPKEDGVECSK